MTTRLLSIALTMLVPCLAFAQDSIVDDLTAPQSTIEDTLSQAFATGSEAPLTTLATTLAEKEGSASTYWLAYCHLYTSYYYAGMQQDDKVREALEDGIKVMEAKEEKDSEDYALLAFLRCQTIRFVSGVKAGMTVSQSIEEAGKATDLDPKNLRGWYVRGVIDYYTPREFGGQAQCEEFLLRAISLPEQTTPDATLPSWGKVEAYTVLIEYYLGAEKPERAKEIYDLALKEYPDAEALKPYASKL